MFTSLLFPLVHRLGVLRLRSCHLCERINYYVWKLELKRPVCLSKSYINLGFPGTLYGIRSMQSLGMIVCCLKSRVCVHHLDTTSRCQRN